MLATIDNQLERTFCSLSKGIAGNREFEAIIGSKIRYTRFFHQVKNTDVILTWGRKHKRLAKSAQFAKRKKIPLWYLEDGFLCFVAPPSKGGKRYSLIIDDIGIYYDSTRPSKLENIINSCHTFDYNLLERAAKLRKKILAHRISKYNHQGDTINKELLDKIQKMHGEKVLVVDQTKNDASITYGLADEPTFHRMLEEAITQNSKATIFVKLHPDIKLGVKEGHFTLSKYSNDKRLIFIDEECNPHHLLSLMNKVYVVTSQMGFDALLHDLPVHTYGMPFYAGWGLTIDEQTIPRRKKTIATVNHLIAACLLSYCEYFDCTTPNQDKIDASTAVDLLHSQRFFYTPFSKKITTLGFSTWRKSFIKYFLPPKTHIEHKNLLDIHATPNERILLWGSDEKIITEKTIYCEDGFIRSVGLGAELRKPSSLIIDGVGLYYDCRSPSSLENYLNFGPFNDHQNNVGNKIISKLKHLRISKYNLNCDFKPAIPHTTQKVILIPGQVENDASIKLGSPVINTNEALLRVVREEQPDAYIMYKPHPDVEAQRRNGGQFDPTKWANTVLQNCSINTCLDICDEVHTMTSTTGFEALIRGIKVKCYGIPFYSNWGLTEDRIELKRRNDISLQKLCYGVLVLYPSYFHWQTKSRASVFEIIDELALIKNSNNLSPELTSRGRLRLLINEKFGI